MIIRAKYEEEMGVYEAELAERSEWDPWHQKIMEQVLPRRAYVSQYGASGTGNEFYDRCYDTTAAESVSSLANMMTSQLTPAGQPWGKWGPQPPWDDDEEICDYYAKCSEVVWKLLHRSNYYGVRHEVNLDTVGPGTGAMVVTRGKRNFYNFQHRELGSYTFQEDAEGRVNAMRYEEKLSAAQCAEHYPRAQWGEKVAEALGDARKRHSQKFTVITVIRPRDEREPGKIDQANLAWAYILLCKEDRKVVAEGGFDQFPGAVYRFQKWGGGTLWGVSPTRKVMPMVHQLNFLEAMMDEAAEVALNPRILSLAGQVGEIDYRAAGRTLATAKALQLNAPREWMTGARHDVGETRADSKREAMKRMFFSSLWGDLSHDSKTRTATEIEEIVRRDRLMFLPVANRFADDDEVLMARLFAMALDEPGLLPNPPEKLLREAGEVPDPVTAYQTRVFKAMEEEQTAAFDELYLRVSQVAQFEPDAFDDFDTSAALREIARSKGVLEKVIRPRAEVAEIRRAKAEAAQEMQNMAMAQGAAQVAKDIPPELRPAAAQQLKAVA